MPRPDPWQARLLCSTALNVLVCASRQTGKSTATQFAAIHQAVTVADSLVICCAPSLRQSCEFQHGIARRKTRVNALMTRASIFLVRKSLQGWMDCRVKPGNDDPSVGPLRHSALPCRTARTSLYVPAP
jgi:hypothetical protein